MTALPEDAPLTRRQARQGQQQPTSTDAQKDEARSADAQRADAQTADAQTADAQIADASPRRRASTSEPVPGGEIPTQAAAAPQSSSSAPSASPTGGLTRRQLRELERTGSIEQIPAQAAPVAPPVEDPAPSVALPPRTPDQVVAPSQKQNKAAKQQAAKAAQQAAAAEAEAKAEAERAEAAERKEAERKETERKETERKETERKDADARRVAEQAAAAEREAKARASQAPSPAASGSPAVATGSLFDTADRDDISEDPASTLSKGFGRDSMLVAALEAEKASQADTGVAFEDLLGSNMTSTGQITTSSLIIPVAPAQAEAGATSNSTGEILITGTIDLPRGLGSSGQDPNHFDGAGIDRLVEGDELPASVTAASPVAASKAVSSHGSTRDVVPATTNQSNKLLMTLAIAAAVLAAGVIAVLIIGFFGGAF